MRYERPWQGDAIATPVCCWLAREDGIFEGFEGGSWDQVDKRGDRTDAGLTGVKEYVGHLEPVRAAHPSRRGATQDRAVAERAAIRQADVCNRPKWSISITSILAGLWSTIRSRREIHRMKAAWETVDDRTLKDIGVSRYEFERARSARHWS